MKRNRFSLTIAFLAVMAVRYGYHKLVKPSRVPLHYSTMQWTYHRSPPPHPGTLTLPSSAGDTASELMKALSSDTPIERLQAVRQAQDKWGSRKVAQDIDRYAILGRWNSPISDAIYRTFKADGTFTNSEGFIELEGTYRFLSNREIELTFPGLLFGQNVKQLEYRLLGDTLEFKALGFWYTYTRATP